MHANQAQPLGFWEVTNGDLSTAEVKYPWLRAQVYMQIFIGQWQPLNTAVFKCYDNSMPE